jgi:hypothetical protein
MTSHLLKFYEDNLKDYYNIGIISKKLMKMKYPYSINDWKYNHDIDQVQSTHKVEFMHLKVKNIIDSIFGFDKKDIEKQLNQKLLVATKKSKDMSEDDLRVKNMKGQKSSKKLKLDEDLLKELFREVVFDKLL